MDQAAVLSIAQAMIGTPVSAAEPLAGGNYNECFKVNAGSGKPYLLRLAPLERDQFSSERHLMRNEYLGRAFLSDLAGLVPPVVAADFSHSIVDRTGLATHRANGSTAGRDALVIEWVEGVSGKDYLRVAQEPQALMFRRSMGDILRR